MIFGINIKVSKFCNTENSTVFSSTYKDNFDSSYNERNILFGEAIYDLSNFNLKENEPSFLRINTIFGSSKVIIKKDMPVKVKVNAAFSGVILPDGNQTVIGTNFFKTNNADSALNCLNIDVNVVFGSFKLKLVD